MIAKHLIGQNEGMYWAFFEKSALHTPVLMIPDDVLDQILEDEGYKLIPIRS